MKFEINGFDFMLLSKMIFEELESHKLINSVDLRATQIFVSRNEKNDYKVEMYGKQRGYCMKVVIKENHKIIAEHCNFKKFYIDDFGDLCVCMNDSEVHRYPFHIGTTDFYVICEQ